MGKNADLIPHSADISPEEDALYSDVRSMIAEARKRAYIASIQKPLWLIGESEHAFARISSITNVRNMASK